MAVFTASTALPHIPDNLSIPQFFLDIYPHSERPQLSSPLPWLIEDSTGREISHENLRTRTDCLAKALKFRWNIEEDDVACIFSPNHVDYPVAMWAMMRLGGIVTPANANYSPNELAHQLETAKVSLIFVHPAFLNTVLSAVTTLGLSPVRIVLFDLPNMPPSVLHPSLSSLIDAESPSGSPFVDRTLDPGEAKKKIAFLSFSSGTTGKPKAVAISHYAVIANVLQMAAHHNVNGSPRVDGPFKPGDIVTAVLPFFHIYGLVVNLHFMIFSAVPIVVIPSFKFVEFLASIVRHRISHLFLVPPQIVLLCKHPAARGFDLSHVKFILCGAAPLSAELVRQLIVLYPKCRIGQGYGMTETCASVSMVPPTQKLGTIGSAGQLIPGTVAKVIRVDGSLAGPGQAGELVVTGPSMALGYLNNTEANKETFVDGWVRTGDEVIFAENGDIFIVDRLKEILKVRGFQVSPAELEGHLLDHPDVQDACVVSLLDDYSGEIPRAYVVLSADAAKRVERSPEEASKIAAGLIKYVQATKVQYKWLAGGVEFIEVIPKSPSGKILRRVLQDKARKTKASGGIVAQAKL